MMGGTHVGTGLLKSSTQGWGRFRGSLRGRRPHRRRESEQPPTPLTSTADHVSLAMGPQGMATHLWDVSTSNRRAKHYKVDSESGNRKPAQTGSGDGAEVIGGYLEEGISWGLDR